MERFQPIIVRPSCLMRLSIVAMYLYPLGLALGSIAPLQDLPTAEVTWLFESLPIADWNGVWDRLTLDASGGVGDELGGAGFIRLRGGVDRGKHWLEIMLVKKPASWPVVESFCSQMMPAAVADWYARFPEFQVETLTSISVVNAAHPPVVGCRCYGRLMVSMNITLIGGGVRSLGDLPKFCEAQSGHMDAIRIPKAQTTLPPVSEAAVAHLQKAVVHKRRYPL